MTFSFTSNFLPCSLPPRVPLNHPHSPHTSLALVEEAGPELKGHDQAIWLDNLRAALSWTIGRREGRKVADAAWTSWMYWWLSGHISEGRRWIEEPLASEPVMPATYRARLLTLAATLGQAIGDFDSSRLGNDESMELFRELGDTDGMYFAMGTAALIALAQGQPDKALPLMEESGERRLELFEDRWAASAMFGFSATVTLGQGTASAPVVWLSGRSRWPGR